MIRRWHGCVFKGMMMGSFRSGMAKNVSDVSGTFSCRPDVVFRQLASLGTLNPHPLAHAKSFFFSSHNPLTPPASSRRCVSLQRLQQTAGIFRENHKWRSDSALLKVRLAFSVLALNAIRLVVLGPSCGTAVAFSTVSKPQVLRLWGA